MVAVNLNIFWSEHTYTDSILSKTMRQHKFVTIFKKLTKFSVFGFEIAKGRSEAKGFASKSPAAPSGWGFRPQNYFFVTIQSRIYNKKKVAQIGKNDLEWILCSQFRFFASINWVFTYQQTEVNEKMRVSGKWVSALRVTSHPHVSAIGLQP